MTFLDPLRLTRSQRPEAAAVVGLPTPEAPKPPVWTYAELDDWVDRVSRALQTVGIGPGDRVGMRLPPCPEAVVLLHAVHRIGATLLPLHPGWTDAEVARGIAVVGPPALLVSRVGELLEWDGEGPPSTHEPADPFPTPEGGHSAPLAILLTSGTTGAPRPIPITHRNLVASARGAAERLDLAPEDRWLTSLSPAHIGGLALLHRAAFVGSSLLTRPRFDAEELSVLLDQGEVTHLSLVPVMLQRLLEYRGGTPAPSGLRCILLGGDGVREELLDEALALNYPVALTYGLTESTSQAATADPERVRRRGMTVGLPLPGVELRIEGPDPEGRGEILLRGETVVSGIPILDGDRSSAHPSTYLSPSGWLHTGDLGRLDEEGDLHILGRLTDRMVTAGVTVEPAEVERVLARHPAVREVAIVGVPDPEWGERLLAVVVPVDPQAPPTLQSLLDFSRERLAPAKRPRDLHLVSALPHTGNGKLDRRALRADPRADSGVQGAG